MTTDILLFQQSVAQKAKKNIMGNPEETDSKSQAGEISTTVSRSETVSGAQAAEDRVDSKLEPPRDRDAVMTLGQTEPVIVEETITAAQVNQH